MMDLFWFYPNDAVPGKSFQPPAFLKTGKDNKAAHANPLSAPESKSEGNEKPQPESEMRPQ